MIKRAGDSVLLDQTSIGGDVAIVGMACTFPRARNLEEFWQNIVNGTDAVHDVAPQRWGADVFYDPQPGAPDRVYCKRGGYLGTSFSFNPLRYGTMPRALDGAEPDQFLVLRTVYEAMADAGYAEGGIDGQRAAFILGRGNYLGAGLTALVQRSLITEQTLLVLKALHPDWTDKNRDDLKKALRTHLPGFGPDTVPGLIPNVTTGRVANRLDLMGPTFTVDAACASSLIATQLAIRGLLSGEYDLALTGGVHVFTDVPFLQVFCAMGALSESSVIRPFDKHCDGIVPGEGVGILVLKRLADARRDDDRIYAVIKGVGTSSDGKALSVTAPRLEGEELALRRAYDSCGVPVGSIGLVEAHGTGTRVGDETEIQALHKVFGPRQEGPADVALGAVKSMIGHAMPAAGAAGLIKTALALHHRVLPPTLHCREPADAIASDQSRFYVNTQTRPWIHGSPDGPRRAGVSAFGFGGVNAHVVMEEYAPGADPTGVETESAEKIVSTAETIDVLARQWDAELFLIHGQDRDALLAATTGLQRYVTQASEVRALDLAYTLNTSQQDDGHCLAIVAESIPDLSDKLARAAERLADPDCRQIKDSKGIYFFAESPAAGHKLAFLFPGLGSQYVNMMADLCMHFAEVRRCFDNADRSVARRGGYALSGEIFPPPAWSKEQDENDARRLDRIERANSAVMAANGAMHLLLDKLGVKPDMMTGHSSGEWVVMPASGMIGIDEFVSSMTRLEGLWHTLGQKTAVPTRAMLAVGTDRDTVARLAEELDRPIQVANDNCPHQVVVVVHPDDTEAVIKGFLGRGVFVEKLPHTHGYHTPEFVHVNDALHDYFSSLAINAPQAALYSCTTAKPYPDEPGAIVSLLSQTFARPLLFRDTVEAMYRDGARVFVEVGPRANLTAFVNDILRGRPHVAIATNHQRRSGLSSLQHALGLLAALRVPLNLAALYKRRSPTQLTLDPEVDRPVDENGAEGCMQISLCSPRLGLSPEAIESLNLVGSASPPVSPVVSAPEAAVLEPSNILADPGGVGPAAEGVTRPDVALKAGPMMQEHIQLMDAFLQTHEQVMQAYLAGPAALTPGQTVPADVDALAQAGRQSAARQAAEVDPPAPEPAGHFAGDQAASVIERVPEAAEPEPLDLEALLVGIVSEKTGYPPDMLDLDLDMEGDLGIDSIKRIEIMSALQQSELASSLGQEVDLEEVAKLTTLRQVLEMLASVAGDAVVSAPTSPATASAPHDKDPVRRVEADSPMPDASTLAFSGRIERWVPGVEVEVHRELDLQEDLYLQDHCFDPYVSDADPHRERLSVVPLTVSLEMMAEVASLLMPGRVVVGAKQTMVGKWIDINPHESNVVLVITAKIKDDPDQVHVTIGPRGADQPVGDSTVVFADRFPTAPEVGPLVLEAQRPPRQSAEELYSDRRMFHGPRFRGVAALEAVGRNGLVAQLEVLPTDNLFKSTPDPRFHIDPFLLDAAGQLVGYWPIEYLDEGFVLFPIRIKEVIRYRRNLQPGQRARCQLRVTQVSSRQLSADLDIIAPDGTLWMRIIGWEDWRFYWSLNFYDFWRYPDRELISESVVLPAGVCSTDAECRRMAPVGELGKSIWENLWAHMILSRRELGEYRGMAEGPGRTAWILGRVAAKDAVRTWVKRRCGLVLYPADVEVHNDQAGQPIVGGYWLDQVGRPPHLSISHKNTLSIALADDQPVGIDLEWVESRDDGFRALAFAESERALLESLNGRDPDEWYTRAWCGKEAAGKAMGTGLADGPRQMVIRAVDADTGEMHITCEQNGAAQDSAPPRREFAVHTTRDGDYVMAVALGIGSAHATT